MPSTREQIPPERKRQRTEPDPSIDHSSERLSKRIKSSTRLHSAAFYDSLSKVWLTRRALRELNRRTDQLNCAQHPTYAPRPAYQGDISKRELQRFARHGGPDLRDLRGYPPPADVSLARNMSIRSSRYSRHSSRSKQTKSTGPTNTSSSTRRSSAYDNDFEQHLVDNHIFTDGYDYPDGRETPEPVLDGFHERLTQPRPSLSPSQFAYSDFKDFKHANARAISEGKVMSTVLPVIYGKSNIPNEGDLVFTSLDPIANDVTVDAKPDFYDGARLENLDKRVQEDLGNFIIPTGHVSAPVVPNFFLEAKAPRGGADIAKRQACYNGALGARAMHQLQSYTQAPVYDGKGYTISTTYHAGTGTMQMYTTHPTEGPRGSTEYHMTQVNTWGLTGNVTSFRQGATAFRNARDWAQEQRDTLISAANSRARSEYAESSQLASSDKNDACDLAEVQDDTQVSQAECSEGDSQYYTTQHQEEYHNNQSNFATSFDDSPDTSQAQRVEDSSVLELSEYHDTDTTVPHLVESETSTDELAVNSYTTSTIPSKRRHKTLRTKSSKAPRGRGKSKVNKFEQQGPSDQL